MAKSNKKALLIGGAALAAVAALYFWNKNKNVEEFAQPAKSAVKPQAVNTPVVTMAQAAPKMFNPVNNTLNNLTNVKPRVAFLAPAKKPVYFSRGNKEQAKGVNGGLPIL